MPIVLVDHLLGVATIEPQTSNRPGPEVDVETSEHDLAEIHGQEEGRRAMTGGGVTAAPRKLRQA